MRTESCSEGTAAPSPGDTEEGKIPSVHKFVDVPQLGVSNKVNVTFLKIRGFIQHGLNGS